MAVFAPAGYGKTTLLAQAPEFDGRRFGWISLEDADNDPVVLAAHLAQALRAYPDNQAGFGGVPS